MARGGSKLLTGIISFLLGFLFAILVEVGAVFGVYWFVMNNDINTVMATIGIPNTDDRYINTDKENGGVTTLKELLSGVQGLVFENGELAIVGKSFDDISNLIPATQILLDTFYGIADEYIELDHEEFESNPLMNLAQVLSDSVLNIRTATLMEKLGVIGDDANILVKTLVKGSECDYATVKYADGRESTLKLPVMYDYYGYDKAEDIYYNCMDNASAFPANLAGRKDALLTPSGDRYTLYFVPCKVTANGIEEAEYLSGETTVEDNGKTYKFQILEYGADTDFIAVEYNGGDFEIDYNAVYAALNGELGEETDYSQRFTGYSYYQPYARKYYYAPEKDEETGRWSIKTVSGKNYFRDNNNKLVQLDALTLYDIISDPFSPLDSVLVSDVIEGESNIKKIFGTMTLGMLLRGEGIDEIIEDLEVSTFMTNVSPSNKVMCYIAYKISDLQNNGDGTYTAVYDKDGADEQVVTVTLDESGNIYEVEGVEGVKVKDVAALANNMPITVLMDVRVDEPIMVYLGYGVTGVKEQRGDGYSHVGEVKVGDEERQCYILTEETDGVVKVTAVWYFDDEGERVFVGGTKVNNVANRVNSFADDLTVGDVLSLDGSESPMLNAIKDTKLSGMADRIEELTVKEILDGDKIEDSAILRQLKDKKVSELTSAIDSLYIQMVYAEEVYGVSKNAQPKPVTESDEYHEEWLYYVKDGDAFVLATQENPPEDETAYDDALGHITSGQFNSNEGTYYTYGEAKGMWRLVLYKEGKEKAYTMNNFNNMVAACADSVNDATLSELQKAGVVNATKEKLDKKLKFTNGGASCYVKADGSLTLNETEGVTLGEMKLASLINFVVNNLLAA